MSWAAQKIKNVYPPPNPPEGEGWSFRGNKFKSPGNFMNFRQIDKKIKSECRACGKMNHWAKWCLARKPRDNKNKPHQRGRSKSRNEFRQRKHYHTKDTSVHQICSNEQNTATLEQTFNALNFHEVKMSAMCLQQNSRDEAYVQVQIKLNNRPGIHNLSAKMLQARMATQSHCVHFVACIQTS